MKKAKFGPGLGITIALGVLSIVQFVLTNRKEAKEAEQLKADLKKEILKDISKET